MTDPVNELASYLESIGEPIHREWFGGHDITVQQELDKFLAEGKTLQDFYRENWTYLYHLTWFGEDIWKEPYRRFLMETLPPPLRMLEFGCGIGADGLKFIESGYDVEFADFPSRCTEYLKWRLKWRKETGWRDIPIYDLDNWRQPSDQPDIPVYALSDAPHDYDLVYAFDVVEHSETPKDLLEQIETYGKMVAVNIFRHMPASDTEGPRLHYWYDGELLKDWIVSRKEIVTLRDCDYAYFIIYK